jgi:hypothetical protein
MCLDHPNAPACLVSVFAGNCIAHFSCSGDAATCAIAKASNETNCALRDDTDATIQKGKQIIAGTDPDSATLPDASKPQVVNVGQGFDMTERFSGSCFSDITLSVMGRSIVLPMTTACQWGGYLGNIGVGLSLLVGAFVVMGAIRQGA